MRLDPITPKAVYDEACRVFEMALSMMSPPPLCNPAARARYEAEYADALAEFERLTALYRRMTGYQLAIRGLPRHGR